MRRSVASPASPAEKAGRKPWLAVAGIAVIIILGIIVTQLRSSPVAPTAKSDERYYFTDSKYQGIRSKFVTRQSPREKVSLEYPITGRAEVDKRIASAIDQDDAVFRQAVAYGLQFSQPMTETTSYQITHNDGRFLSIIVMTNQDMHGAHPASIAHFWTFDVSTGQVLTLRDVVGGSDDGVRAVLDVAKKMTAEAIKKHQQSDIDLDEFITEERLENFIVGDRDTIAWPFGRGMVLASAYGEIAIRVPVAGLAEHLQNDIAKSLFKVPEPPKKPLELAPPPISNCAAGKCIALTFDDGPGPHTARLLDMLDQRGAKATFYVLGSKVQASAAILQRMQATGYQIGNHTWNHPDLTRLDAAGIQRELVQTNEAIRQVTGQMPTTARPPYGAVNGPVLAQLGQAGVASILWSVDTRDWADRNSDIVCNRAVAGARAGAIILLHDIHATSVDAVPCIVDALRGQGYSLVTVNTLLGNTTPGASYTGG